MRKIYIDFDDVILATNKVIFKNWCEDRILFDKKQRIIDYLKHEDWERIIQESQEIGHALKIIRNNENQIKILTKIHSLKEGVAKVHFFRKNNIKNEIILVPHQIKKTDMVNAKDNILIDDQVGNLEDWQKHGGIPIFLNKDNLNTDIFDRENNSFVKVRSLNFLK